MKISPVQKPLNKSRAKKLDKLAKKLKKEWEKTGAKVKNIYSKRLQDLL